jgi:hypothetical protein
MKLIKILGLAAVAAAALMALAGAGTASASVLCSTNVWSGCGGTAWAVPNGTVIELSVDPETTPVLEDTAGFVQDTCTESSSSGALTQGTATATAKGTVTAANLKWGGCTNATKTLTGGTLEIHHIAGGATANGTITASGFEVTVVVLGVTCTFTSGTGLDLGTLTEGKPATADINAVVTSKSIFCPTSARWTANYIVTKPANTTLAVSAS